MDVVHQVAFDGSGTFGDHAAIAYGGAIGTTAQWSAFSDAWQTVLQREGLRYFRMAEAMTWFGEFRSKHTLWASDRNARRDVLLNELVSLAVRHQLKSAAAFADARLMTPQHGADKKEELFKSTVLPLLRGLPPDQDATLICDAELDTEARIKAWMLALRRDSGDRIAAIADIHLVDERKYPPVQLADLIAWLCRERGERWLATGDRALHPLLARLQRESHLDLGQSPEPKAQSPKPRA